MSDLNFTPRTTAFVSPESSCAGVAASKIVCSGVIALEAADCGLVPTALVDVTLNV